jgi:hypothetical protein
LVPPSSCGNANAANGHQDKRVLTKNLFEYVQNKSFFMNSVYNTPKIKQNDNHQISLNIAHLLVDLNHAQTAGMLQQDS